MRRRRKRDETADEAAGSGAPALWLQLAHEEIEMRTHAAAAGHQEVLDRMLQLEARLKLEYPDMPPEVKNEFSARVSARGYSEEAWNAAVTWLQATDWFRFR